MGLRTKRLKPKPNRGADQSKSGSVHNLSGGGLWGFNFRKNIFWVAFHSNPGRKKNYNRSIYFPFGFVRRNYSRRLTAPGSPKVKQ